MDLAKFVSMLAAEALHFARADIMEDVFEGSVSRGTREDRRHRVVQMSDETFGKFNAKMAELGKAVQEHTYLNCWHMGEHESAAMWKIYQGGNSQSIAIRSTYRNLITSLQDSRSIFVGTVSYVDFDTDVVPAENIYHPMFHKRKSYDYEREIRAIYADPCIIDFRPGPAEFRFTPLGSEVIPIAVSLDNLVERVYVSPKARPWFAEVVRDVVSRYGRNWPVDHSSLDCEPIF